MRAGGTLWRALETARRANCTAAGETLPQPGGQPLPRRALLKGLAASATVAAMPRPAHAFTGGRVAVIGGGIAGLTALHRLRAAGVDAHLYEARGRIGGRMFTWRPADGGTPFEQGGQLVNSDHRDIHMLAADFGIALLDRKEAPHRSLLVANGALVPPDALAEALRPIAARIGADADRLDADYARVAPILDRLSVADYLDRHADKLPQSWVRRLLEATARTEYGAEPQDASALELIFNLPTVDGRRVEVLGGSDEQFVLDGGSGALTDAIAARHAAHITTGRRLLRIDPIRGGLRLSFLDGSTAHADRVIVAVPAPILRQIHFGVPLPQLWRHFIETVELGRNEKVQAATRGRPARAALGAGGELWDADPEAGYALGWDGSVPGAAAPVWTWYLGGDQVDCAGPADARAAAFAARSVLAIPGFAQHLTSEVRATRWCRDPLTLGAYSNYRPGQLTRFAPLFWVESHDPAERQQAIVGPITFAGEHLSDAWPGYMNGGAQTGRLAAETLIGSAAIRAAA